jgi:Tfp pilus assembly protein PilO
MNTNKWIIYSISGLFILSGFFCIISLVYTSMENVTAKGLQERIDNCQKELAQLSKEEASLSDWRNIGKYFDQFKNDYLMKMEEYSHFRDNLRITFNKYGLKNRMVEHSYKKVFGYRRVNMSFSVEGTYPQIKRFIHDILNRKQMIVIKQIKLSKSKRSASISGNFRLEVYLVK